MTKKPALTLTDALQALRDALGENYGAATDDVTLTRALAVDEVVNDDVVHPRPWGTAVRLIKWNTEYELTGELRARIDRKLGQLVALQAREDVRQGVDHLVVRPRNGLAGQCGPVDTKAAY